MSLAYCCVCLLGFYAELDKPLTLLSSDKIVYVESNRRVISLLDAKGDILWTMDAVDFLTTENKALQKQEKPLRISAVSMATKQGIDYPVIKNHPVKQEYVAIAVSRHGLVIGLKDGKLFYIGSD